MPRTKNVARKSGYGTTIREALDKITKSGDFCGGASVKDFPLPGLTVNGVGMIGMPLPPVQAEEIKRRCAPAPFGRKEKTIYDANVRDTWQLEPDQFQFTNFDWTKFLKRLVPNVQRELGCEETEIEFKIYKLLLYETGQHFARHRDTEKVERMFATLVVSLPSVYTGGSIVVKHGKKERTFDHAAVNNFQVCWAAFYADCEHEILPVTSGYRLSIVFSVCFRGGIPPAVPQSAPEIERVCKALDGWLADADGSKRLFYFLEHKYTKSGFSFANLKGRDRAVGQAMRQARLRAPFGFVFALVYRNWSGSAEGGGYCGWERGEEYGSSTDVMYWVAPDSEVKIPRSIAESPSEEECLQQNYFDHIDPDSESVEEATGNEGATMEIQYRAAAFIFFKIEEGPTRPPTAIPAVKKEKEEQELSREAPAASPVKKEKRKQATPTKAPPAAAALLAEQRKSKRGRKK